VSAAHLPEAVETLRDLERRLGEARLAAGEAVRAALAAGETYRSLASRFGLSLGAVQRLAGSTVEAPKRAPLPGRGSGGTNVQGACEETPAAAHLPQPVPATRVCVRAGCTAEALPGKLCCHPHHVNW
jgi:hypothetical protein